MDQKFQFDFTFSFKQNNVKKIFFNKAKNGKLIFNIEIYFVCADMSKKDKLAATETFEFMLIFMLNSHLIFTNYSLVFNITAKSPKN